MRSEAQTRQEAQGQASESSNSSPGRMSATAEDPSLKATRTPERRPVMEMMSATSLVMPSIVMRPIEIEAGMNLIYSHEIL